MSNSGQRKWRQHWVDMEFTDEFLETLNSLADRVGSRITSLCAGHPEGRTSQGGGEYPHLYLEFGGEEPEKVANDIASRLQGPHNSIRLDGRRDANRRPYVFLHLASTIKNTGSNRDELSRWWNEVFKQLQAALQFGPVTYPKRRVD